MAALPGGGDAAALRTAENKLAAARSDAALINARLHAAEASAADLAAQLAEARDGAERALSDRAKADDALAEMTRQRDEADTAVAQLADDLTASANELAVAASEIKRLTSEAADRNAADSESVNRRKLVVRRCGIAVVLGGQSMSWVGTVAVAISSRAVGKRSAYLLPTVVEGASLVCLAALVLGVAVTRSERRFCVAVMLTAAAVAVLANWHHAGPSAIAKILGLAPTVLSTAVLKVVIPHRRNA